ncbi:hypothetical protein [Campylobacter insulaenigrae]|uniref:hypothetical protein n=1 Tax=Campylobacter insulaenigrae TaxID=260714 RepID=UPI002152A5AE|nr:hypothetical protein [Campylobacter insulaenigrae]MCR6580386.1 hypothetical protein [Campylobacter insulaenigrae]
MQKKPSSIMEALNSEASVQKTYVKADGKKTAGRKAIDKELRRERTIICKLNERESNLLEQLMALELSTEISAYIRKLILKEARNCGLENT